MRHFDLEETERKLREVYQSPLRGDLADNPFARRQLEASEVHIQFAIYMTKLENEDVSIEEQIDLAAACLASMFDNASRNIATPVGTVRLNLIQLMLEKINAGGTYSGRAVINPTQAGLS